MGGIRRFIGSLGCHQLPERCFRFGGKPMPLCARCFGAAVGQLAAICWAACLGFPPYLISLALLVPMAIDVLIQKCFRVLSTNGRRFVTGILGGFGLSCLAYGLAWRCASWFIHRVIFCGK